MPSPGVGSPEEEATIRAKLVSAFLVLGLVPAAAIGLFAYSSSEASLTRTAGRQLEDSAFIAVDKLDRNLFERYGDVQAFALSEPARALPLTRPARYISAEPLVLAAIAGVRETRAQLLGNRVVSGENLATFADTLWTRTGLDLPAA